jgi:hypothetical protein
MQRDFVALVVEEIKLMVGTARSRGRVGLRLRNGTRFSESLL